MTATSTLAALNAADRDGFVAQLDGVYEHSPWIAAAAWSHRPFATLAALKAALVDAVRDAGHDAQLALLRAHPELAGRAMVSRTLTAASAGEQRGAGLNDCSPAEFAQLHELNAAYRARFEFPFIVAVRGPRGSGLSRAEIIATFERRLGHAVDTEFEEGLRNVHRIAELRLNERYGHAPVLGEQVWDRAEALAAHSEDAAALTVTYLSDAHRAVARQLADWMQGDGFDRVDVDAVGNVVGVYDGQDADAPRLLTGSHYDTVRNAGKYDGRLGILVAMAAVRELHRARRRLPFAIEVVAFAEEEGQRWPAAFIGSSALVGEFDAAWLDLRDAGGTTLRDAMAACGLDPAAIAALRRDPARYAGFVEVHIEQGPVLAARGRPLGVVTAINGSRRFRGDVVGVANHAGTTPMDRRRDAAAGAAEWLLAVERRAVQTPGVVATVGVLDVPGGSVNVVPGRCRYTLDVRAPHDADRDACAADVAAALRDVCDRRGLSHTLDETLSAAAAPCDAAWRRRWERALHTLGVPVQSLPSGAGHDAMKLHRVLPQAMLFVRGGNDGISHNPLEAVTADDADLAVRAFAALLDDVAAEPRTL